MTASSTSSFAALRAALRAWWTSLRTPASALQDMDERLLNDIGLTRAGTPRIDLLAASWDAWPRTGVQDLHAPLDPKPVQGARGPTARFETSQA